MERHVKQPEPEVSTRTSPHQWLSICKVPLDIRSAPRFKGDIISTVQPGDLVEFTPFPKRGEVVPRDLTIHPFLRCRKVQEDGSPSPQQGWVSCKSEDAAVHFVPVEADAAKTERSIDFAGGQASLSEQLGFARHGFRGPSQNTWLNTLPRLRSPAPPQKLLETAFQRMLVGGRVSGKFRGVLVCDALAGPCMAARPSMDRLACNWLRESFSTEAAPLPSVELASVLEKHTVEDRHRLVLLLVQEPHAWAARAELDGFVGAFLAGHPEGSAEGERLEYSISAGQHTPSLMDGWLQNPVECFGNVHMDGLLSLWAWFLQDLASAALEPAARNVVLCRVEDILFDTQRVMEALLRLGFERKNAERPVLSPPKGQHYRQALEAYRPGHAPLVEKNISITQVADLRGAMGYVAEDCLRWSLIAEQQLALMQREGYVSTTVIAEPVEEAGGASQVTAYVQQKLAAPFDGVWSYVSGRCTIADGVIHWESGSVTKIEVISDIAFHMELEGEIFQGRLDADSQKLVFSDGDVWNRIEPQVRVTEPSSAPAMPAAKVQFRPGDGVKYWSSSSKRWMRATVQRQNSDGTFELDVKKRAKPDCLRPARARREDTNEQASCDWTEMLKSAEAWADAATSAPSGDRESRVVDAVAEVLFEAVARVDIQMLQSGLQEVQKLGGDAVQRLLDSRDAAGATLLQRSALGAPAARPMEAPTHGAAGVAGSAELVRELLAARADVNAAGADGETPLLAVSRHRIRRAPFEVERALLAAKADLEAAVLGTDLGFMLTPLMWAARRGSQSFCELLLEARAQVTSCCGGFSAAWTLSSKDASKRGWS
eukprot:TRINITY_DN17698_c0_g1_i1.p1 TRINITY_DN17698_c0_g1~~TRINITY_DN17698_c0_g1_i1.p1  ORF type:complete len:827 (-),score=184.24 TRINITY_DN17698_c0_g1_i1:45-2525(-)